MNDQEQTQPQKEPALTPGQIADMKEAAAALKQAIRGPGEEVGMERSGQLSPSHTPGRGR